MALPADEAVNDDVELDQFFMSALEDTTPAKEEEPSEHQPADIGPEDSGFHQAPPPSNLPGA